MGQQVTARTFGREDRQRYRRKVKACLDVFARMLSEARFHPEMRSFGEVLVHVFSGTTYAAKAGRGEAVQWSELDPKSYADKAAVVAGFKKAIAEADATLKATPATRFAASPEPWLSVIEHSAEHYGLLVAYYRLNNLVPPASRPKK